MKPMLAAALVLAVISVAPGGAAQASPEELSKAFRDVAASAGAAVVSISTTRVVRHPAVDFRDFFGEALPAPFRRMPRVPEEFEARGQGSGVIVDAAKGVVLTNHHVVSGATEVKVRLRDGREVTGKVVGDDPKSDLAAVRIPAEGLTAAPLGDSDRMQVGDWVVAIGAPFGLEQTVTAGIVSAKGRADVDVIRTPFAEQDFLQTDAAINPGNSGGPLLNLKGEVIGVNTAIAGASGGNQGIGFAVPSNMARRVLAQLLEKGRVVRGWLGVGIQDLTPELAEAFEGKEGVVIAQVQAGSPAGKAGLRPGDLVVAIDGKSVPGGKELRRRISEASPGDAITLTVIRDGKESELKAEVGEQPRLRPEEEEEEEEEEAAASVEAAHGEGPGLAVAKAPEGQEGVVVVRVQAGSPASEKGLRPGVLILSVDRVPVNSPKEFRAAVARSNRKKGLLLLVQDADAAIWMVLKR